MDESGPFNPYLAHMAATVEGQGCNLAHSWSLFSGCFGISLVVSCLIDCPIVRVISKMLWGAAGVNQWDSESGPKYVNNTHLSARVGRLNPDWNEDQSGGAPGAL